MATDTQLPAATQFALKQRLLQKYAQQKSPFSATLEMTNNCNLHCSYCYIVRGTRHNDLSTTEWKSVIDQLADMGCFELVLTGGEPLARRDFFEIAGHARRRNFNIVLFTNGTLITAKVADRIRTLAPNLVEVSVYGTAETDSQITGVKGSFERSIRGIRHLRARDIRVAFKVSWVKENYQDYRYLISLAQELGASFRGNILINYRRDGSAEPLEHRLDDEQLYTLLRALNDPEIAAMDDDQRKEFASRIEKHESYVPGPCGAGRTGVCVAPAGDVYPCVGLNLMKLGNVREQGIADIWRKSPLLKQLQSVTAADYQDCRECPISRYCTLCPADNLLRGESGTTCNLESKRIAGVMQRAEFDALQLAGVCPM